MKKSKKEIQKQQRLREEEEEFKQLLAEEIEREEIRREEEDLNPMKKEDRLKIEQRLLDQREKLRDKERLLQFT